MLPSSIPFVRKIINLNQNEIKQNIVITFFKLLPHVNIVIKFFFSRKEQPCGGVPVHAKSGVLLRLKNVVNARPEAAFENTRESAGERRVYTNIYTAIDDSSFFVTLIRPISNRKIFIIVDISLSLLLFLFLSALYIIVDVPDTN